MTDSWISARASVLSGNNEPSVENVAQATAEADAGATIMSPENVDPTVPTGLRAEFGPALFCGWHGSAAGCRHGDNCHNSHGVVGVAATYETFEERKGRLASEAVNGVPLLKGQKKRKPCRYFRREDGCTKGDACGFSHEKTPCKFFFGTEGCNKEDNCEYSHVKESCRHYYRRGGCRNGDNCKYSHALPTLATKVKECAFFSSGCINGPSCAYNSVECAMRS